MVAGLSDRRRCPPTDYGSFRTVIDDAARPDHPILRRLLDYWSELGDADRLPSRWQIDPAAIPQLLPYITLVDVLGREPRGFRRRLIGTHITAATGRDNTGRTFDEIYAPEVAERMAEAYSAPVDRRRPVRVLGRGTRLDRTQTRYEAVYMPLASDGERVDMVLAGIVFGS